MISFLLKHYHPYKIGPIQYSVFTMELYNYSSKVTHVSRALRSTITPSHTTMWYVIIGVPLPDPKCSTHITLPSDPSNDKRIMELPWQSTHCYSLWWTSSPKHGESFWYLFPHFKYKFTCAYSSRHQEFSKNWKLSYDSTGFIYLLEDLNSPFHYYLITKLNPHTVWAIELRL